MLYYRIYFTLLFTCMHSPADFKLKKAFDYNNDIYAI